jgi:type III pantothenate kinase
VILCVDIGNTSIKLARIANRRVLDLAVVSSRAPAVEVARALSRVARGADSAAIASVRPQATATARVAVRRALGVEPLIVTSRVTLPIDIATLQPSRVGVDRICAACGAMAGRNRHAIVVDAGSAITVDLVLDRRFLGGLIMPGPQMMLSAMHHFTAQLPKLELAGSKRVRFDDTAPAMQAGAMVGSAGAIEAAVRLLRRRADRAVTVWLTGGHAARLRHRLPSSWKYMPGLTLVGLAEIARLNRTGN